MSAPMPELGSKISLISKADIRYEGRLFTVDPQECTIALASVRSFGTEDRETQFPIPAQNQVYDYILFRGSDIKDIRVIQNVPNIPNVPNDPAIMQLSMPPSLGQQQFQPQAFSHPVLGHIPQYAGGYGSMGGMAAPGMGMGQPQQAGGGMRGSGAPLKQPSELLMPGTMLAPELSPAAEPIRANSHGSVLDLIGGGSRSTTPASLGSRKSPTADQGVQVNDRQEDKRMPHPIQPPSHRNQQRDRRDSGGHGGGDRRSMGQGFMRDGDHHRNQNRQQQQYRGPPQNQQHPNQMNNQQQHQHRQQGQQGNWNKRPQQRPRSRPSGKGVHPAPGGFRPNNPPAAQPNAPGGRKSTLKFENDYDFEQANTKFEELRSQFEKVKIKDVTAKPEVNGDAEKKDDSGNETGAGEGEGEVEEEQEVYYNKSKSFFDNISCEAVERSKGRTQRTDWKAERKLNTETFGVSSARRQGYRGGRPGGYYNNRNSGYRPQYRNMNNYRPQGNNRNTGRPQVQQQQQQQQQQSSDNSGPSTSTVRKPNEIATSSSVVS